MTARSHRDAAKVAAKEFVAALCSWSHGHRVTTGRPSPRDRWHHHHALVAVRLRDGTECSPVVVDERDRCATEAAALDALTAKLRAALAEGMILPDPWEAAQRDAFGPPPGPWSSWGAMPDDVRHRLAAKRLEERPRAREATPRFTWFVWVDGATADHNDLAALGLTRPPSPDELTAAWRAAAKQHHPDAGGSAEAFDTVKRSYDRLRAVIGATR